MRTSATCPTRPAVRPAAAGFTLIEITVVLVIMAGIAALALPNLNRLYDSVVERSAYDELIRAVRSASVHAYASRQGFELVAHLRQQQAIPDGWNVNAERPIEVGANGVCRGGRLFIVAPDRSRTLNLQPPFCQPET